jgi:hypothetical protein
MKQTHQEMIAFELENAKRKHPVFCEGMTRMGTYWISIELAYSRSVANEYKQASDILNEEHLEAMESYIEGRLQHCLVELAQCGAVVLRMMEFVQAEIDAKKGCAE